MISHPKLLTWIDATLTPFGELQESNPVRWLTATVLSEAVVR